MTHHYTHLHVWPDLSGWSKRTHPLDDPLNLPEYSAFSTMLETWLRLRKAAKAWRTYRPALPVKLSPATKPIVNEC